MLAVAYLRVQLESARRQGVSFEAAWPVAVNRTRAGTDWLVAFAASRGAWQRAYDRLPPTDSDRAILVLADGMSGVLDSSDDDDDVRVCERAGCDRPIKGRKAAARYCSDECRALAWRAVEDERRRERAAC